MESVSSTERMVSTPPMPSTAKSRKAANSPNVVHASLLKYLRTEFPLGRDWVHPVTKTVFTHDTIKACLKAYKKNNRKNYLTLWWLWTSGATTAFIADRLHISQSTVRRRWDAGISVLLVMLLYPDLTCEEAALYDHEW